MSIFSVRNPFGCRGVSCVKLPAAVAFPTDDRLLQRIEESRRALPPNNMKSLRKRREPLSVISASVRRVRAVDAQPTAREKVSRAAVDTFARAAGSRSTLPQLVRIEELHLRNRAALGQR
jgi:hypothetical protein